MRKKVISKEMLIKAGLEIIETEGLESCTLRHLADKLKIGTGTFYNYFDNYDAFIIAAFETSWEETFYKLELIKDNGEDLYTKILEVEGVIMEDVIRRNNLGKRLFEIFMTKNNAHFQGINNRLDHYLRAILSRVDKPSHKEALIRWLHVLLLANVREKRYFSEDEKILLRRLIVE